MDLSKFLKPKLSKYTVGLSIEEEKKGLSPKRIILIYFYKQGEKLKFFDKKDFVDEIARYVTKSSIEKKELARPKVIFPPKKALIIEPPKEQLRVNLHDIEYTPEWTLFGGDTSAKKLSDYLNGLSKADKPKIVICTTLGTINVIARASKNLIYPIHSIISFNATGTENFNFFKIEDKVYNFYFKNHKKLFEKKPHIKIVNLRCLAELEVVKKTQVEESSPTQALNIGDRSGSFGISISKASQYYFNNDLATILFSERQDYKTFWGTQLPAVFINSPKDSSEIIKTIKEVKKENMISDFALSSGVTQNIQNIIEVSKTENTFLYDLINWKKEKGILGKIFSTAYEYMKKLGRTVGFLYTPHEVKKAIIGPFFVPHLDKIYLVVLAKNEVVEQTNFKAAENKLTNIIKLPFKRKYTVLKADVTNYLGKPYEITTKNFKDGGKIPKPLGIDENYSFFVYGDSRKHDRSRPQIGSDEQEPTIGYRTGEFIKTQNKGIFQLLTGDLIIDGSSVDGWAEFLDLVLLPATKGKLVTSAIGNHDISSSMRTIKNGAYLWFFNPAIPHFGNMFYFQYPRAKLSVNDHVANTQSYFKIGCVGFVHLPLPTEETKYHYLENPFFGEEGIPSFPLIRRGQMSCYNYKSEIYDAFETNLKQANTDKKNNIIKFIIVFGHAPLVTNYSYHVPHGGFFNYLLKKNKAKLSGIELDKYNFAEKIKVYFDKYPVDAYFCGHNHIYDHCSWKIDEKTSIPMVTMGVGTDLKSKKDLSDSEKQQIKFLDKRITPQTFISADAKKTSKEFIGYLDCRVWPKENKITFQLVGERDYKDELFTFRNMPTKLNKNIYDKFTIKPR
jgi:hypothetical protein